MVCASRVVESLDPGLELKGVSDVEPVSVNFRLSRLLIKSLCDLLAPSLESLARSSVLLKLAKILLYLICGRTTAVCISKGFFAPDGAERIVLGATAKFLLFLECFSLSSVSRIVSSSEGDGQGLRSVGDITVLINEVLRGPPGDALIEVLREPPGGCSICRMGV